MDPKPETLRDSPTARLRILRVDDGGRRSSKDVVAREEPLEVQVVVEAEGRRHARAMAVLMRTPGDDLELAAGFLLTEGIVGDRDDIAELSRDLAPDVEIPVLHMRTRPSDAQQENTVYAYFRRGAALESDATARSFYVSSSCGVCGRASLDALWARGCAGPPPGQPVVAAPTVAKLPQRLREAQRVFDRTGGLHGVGVFDAGGRLITLREDVGRHNAMDKVIGRHFLDRTLPLDAHVAVLSGRASWELMQKALFAGIPFVVAVGAPSSLAVDLAVEFGMTLVGFTRPGGFNVYAGGERIEGALG